MLLSQAQYQQSLLAEFFTRGLDVGFFALAMTLNTLNKYN